jgi:two-component system, NtrC family, nitrogen regulation sensor histidine kinase GlnL
VFSARHACDLTSPGFWRDIVDSLADALVVVGPALEPYAVNPAAETMLGASQVGRELIDTVFRQNDWLGRMVRACLETGQNLGHPEAIFNVGPRAITVRAEVVPLLGSDGSRLGAIVLLHDLSRQKSLERTVDSGDSQLRLSPAGLAHEVKNPLTGIKGAAELLATMLPKDVRVRQYCDLILNGVNRIGALIESVLSVSSPQRLRHDPVNIHRVLHQALKMAGLFPVAPPGIQVEQRFDPSLPEVIGDQAALERAFLNLIRNALEAMDNKGTIRLRTRMETEFRLTAEGMRRQFLRVDVMDSGRGMTDEELGQLFTPFFTTKPSGTGLGLILSQRTIALHGGKLWAERGGPAASSPAGAGIGDRPRGMTFKVILPVRSGA